MRIKLFFAIFVVPVSLFSLTDAMDNTSLYNRALGGPHSSMAKDFDTFYNNPSLFSEYESGLSIFRVIVNFKGDAINIANLYLGGKIDLDDTSGLIATLNEEGLTSPLVGLDLVGPISFGYIGNNWGFMVNNSTNFYLDLPGLLSDAEVVAREDLSLSAGIAFPLGLAESDKIKVVFSPGIMFRGILRGEVQFEKDLLGIMSYMDDTSAIMSDYPLYLSPLFALDVGFNIKINDIFMLSGVVKDIYTPILKYPVSDVEGALRIFTTVIETEGNLVYREVNFGIGVDIPLGPLKLVISDLDFYIDYYDLLMFEENPFLHIGTGVDITLLDKLHLLAGFYEGLISLGLNIDLKGFNVGFAMYGSEEGSQPGTNSVFNFMFSLGVSF